MYHKKILFDKFYTKLDVALTCLSHLNLNDYDLIIEPSAGNGSFLSQINAKNKVGLDIFPEHPNIAMGDFLAYDISSQYSNILVVGNPPFGIRNKLSKAFIQKATSFVNVQTVAFILPNVYMKHTLQKCIPNSFRIEQIIHLPDNSFIANNEEIHIPCSFFILDRSSGTDLRFNPMLYQECADFKFGTSDNYDFYVMGAAPTVLKSHPEKNNRGYYIKVKENVNIEDVMYNFKHIKWKGLSSVNGGVFWLTKPELVKGYIDGVVA